ncbi:TonB-dependent receptor [Colwellia echini]|uniref:TonB-dependent receptor plug domain-containing protein n=1 Tax=Colwellia echini TaxID=1982103 RepID=A0ABY3MY22_9GAMM|nr:TonB-dependent receptor plug domain-containing protein [Colwellia echini]TYK66107.1 TonB-dependent receptor plug domain-containing protein [Colwellia echini]
MIANLLPYYILFSFILTFSTQSLSYDLEKPSINTTQVVVNQNTAITTELETITVTAQKRDQSIQSIPITVNVLNENEIVNLGLTDMEDILFLFPNLSTNATTELAVGYSIRGVGTNNPHGNVNQAVGIYRDEISYGTPYSGILGVYDTARIEVLRGPQNSLFGRNTIGGAIHYISIKPSLDDHASGYIIGNVGNYNLGEFTAALNAPLSESVALRITGQSIQREGIYTNLATNSAGEPLGESSLGDKDRQSARAQLLWQPSDNTELLFNYHTANHHGTNIGNRAYGTRDADDPYLLINGVQDFKDNSLPDDKASISPFIENVDANSSDIVNSVDRNGFNPATGDWHKIYNVSSARSYAKISGGFFKLNHLFDNNYSINFSASYDNTLLETADETSGTNSLQFIPNRDASYAQKSYDIRVMSPENQAVRWLVGAYYFNENMDLYTMIRRFNYIGPESNVPRDIVAHNILEQVDEDVSLYGHLEWSLTDNLVLSSGLRYTENNKQADSRFGVATNYNTNPAGGSSISAKPFNTQTDLIFDRVSTDIFLDKSFIENCYSADFADCTILPATIKEYQLQQKLSEWGGKVALDYQLSKNNFTYISFARGFKSGGFDTRALAALFGEGAEQAFLPESLDAYELGLKTQLTSTLQINSAVFYNVWTDLQTFGVFNGEPRYVNIPTSVTKGVESEIKWLPADTWYTQIGIGFLDTEITNSGTFTAADEGHELPNSPAVTLNGLLRKQIDSSFGLFTLESDFRYVSEQIDGLTYDSDRYATKNAQFWLNARLNYQFGQEHQYNVALWAENLTEETYCVDIGMQNIITPTTTQADLGERGIDLTSTITCQPSENSGERFFGISIGVNFY